MKVATEKVPLNLTEVILAQGSMSKAPAKFADHAGALASRPAIDTRKS
jgi:hypothetical protein